MADFFQNYGLWILLVAIFVVIYWFGVSYCRGSDVHRSTPDRGQDEAGSSESKR